MILRFVHLPLLLLLAAVLSLQGCRPSAGREQPQEAHPEPVTESEPSAEDRDVLAALRAAYALEGRLWEERDRIRTREDVVEFFRRGFCEEPARELAGYFWLEPGAAAGGEEPRLRVGEPMLTLPETVRVEQVGPEEARVRLEYPQVDTGPLLSPAQTVRVVLRRMEGTWKVCAIE